MADAFELVSWSWQNHRLESRPGVSAGTVNLTIRYGAMAESKLTIEERDAGDVTILVLTGQMLLDDGDLAFGRRVSDLIDRKRTKVVLDLGGVTYIDSSGVGMIVFQQKALKQHAGDMKLLHLNRRAETLFGMLKLLLVFDRFDDEASAIRSFGWAAQRDKGPDRSR